MKKIFYLLFALLLTSCVNAQAQHHPSHGGANLALSGDRKARAARGAGRRAH